MQNKEVIPAVVAWRAGRGAADGGCVFVFVAFFWQQNPPQNPVHIPPQNPLQNRPRGKVAKNEN